MHQNKMIKCPYCGEMTPSEPQICQHCQYDLPVFKRSKPVIDLPERGSEFTDPISFKAEQPPSNPGQRPAQHKQVAPEPERRLTERSTEPITKQEDLPQSSNKEEKNEVKVTLIQAILSCMGLVATMCCCLLAATIVLGPDPTPTPTLTMVSTTEPLLNPTAIATRTPRPSPRPRFTATPTITTTPQLEPVIGQAAYDVYVRAMPDVESEVVGSLEKTESVTILGRSEDFTWLLILSESVEGWVRADFVIGLDIDLIEPVP